MAKLINNNKLNTFATKLWDKISNSFVSKTKENLVTGKTTLLDGRLLHNALSVVNNTNAIHHIGENTSWCGSPNLTVSANTKISYVCIAVKDDLDIGTQLNNIKLAAVKSNDNQVYHILTVDSALVVKNTLGHISSSKMIMIPVNIAFDTQVYFIAGFNGMKWGNTPRGSNWPTIWPEGRSFPAVGTTLKTNLTNYVPQWFVLSEELSLNDVVTSVNTKASKNDSNTFDGTNIFNANVKLNDTVDIKYKHYIQQLLLDGDTRHGSNWAVYFDRNIYIPAGSYVTYLDIRVTDDVNVGSELSEIYIYEVQRGDNISNDRIVNVPFNNSRIRVSDVDGYGKCIRAQFNKIFDRDTYCIVGQKMSSGKILIANDTKGNIRQAILDRPFVLNPSHTISSMANATNDKAIHRYNIEKVGVLQDDINNINNVLATTIKNTDIGNEANKIPRVGNNGKLDPSILPVEQNGGVRTVNDQSPNASGNVTVYSDNININSSTNKTIKQALDEKVNGSDAVTSSQAGKIVKLDNNGKVNENMFPSIIVKSDTDNTFTKHNSFNDYSPTVCRLFTRKHINSNATGNTEAYPVNTYFAILNEKYTENNKQISHILIPIKNSQVGDVLDISFFTFNNNNQVNYIESYTKRCTVIDEEILGHKCAKIQVNRSSGTSGIGFGFMNMTHSINGRQLGIACIRNTAGGNKIWSQTYSPRNGQTLNATTNATIAYKICYETTSELVTRFELENVTQMYPRMIGEVKQLAYDCGDSFEDGMNTWLRVNGQAISKTEYPALFDKMNTSDDLEELQLLQVDDRVGYYYICVK
ncbi:hypothetical protein [uncultured Clostridium sp.]|uniref:hypothetical protein n=1 Tax=uncultured Clostridium sp. TaxID=59620 RepID=UPI002674029A|nr:hypothetical protein [uncultured Clostridium sp.]